LGDIVGRLTLSWISERFGRRIVGICQGFLGGALLVITALCAHIFIGSVSLFWLLLILTYFVVSGGFAVTVPYAAEVWPSDLRATGLGSAYGVGSSGKILGPLGLGLVLGSASFRVPQSMLLANERSER
jgi:MFS transporter, putative metabolite:H+ symporter